MISEDMYIQTNIGVVPISEMGFAKNNKCTSSPIDNILVGDRDGKWAKVISHSYRENGKCKKITLENGYEIKCSNDHKILTDSGVREFNDIKVNDIIFGETFDYEMNKRISPNYDIYFKKTDTYFPKKMIPELAFLVGLVMNRYNSIKVNEDKLVFTGVNKKINDMFCDIVRDVFQTKKKVVVRDDEYCRVFSGDIISYLNSLCELNKNKQFVPYQILKSNREIMTNFLNGLIFGINGLNTNFIPVYNGKCVNVINQIFSILCCNSVNPWIKQPIIFKHRSKTVSVKMNKNTFFGDKYFDRMVQRCGDCAFKVVNVTNSTSNLYDIGTSSGSYILDNLIMIN